jgi:hypothetical protein
MQVDSKRKALFCLDWSPQVRVAECVLGLTYYVITLFFVFIYFILCNKKDIKNKGDELGGKKEKKELGD